MNPPFFWMKSWFLLKLLKFMIVNDDFRREIIGFIPKKEGQKQQKIWIIF
jgi:hypothetical protein